MSEKIAFIPGGKIPAVPLLHQVAEREGVEAVIIGVRIEGSWRTVYSSEALGGLAMGTMKIFSDILREIEG